MAKYYLLDVRLNHNNIKVPPDVSRVQFSDAVLSTADRAPESSTTLAVDIAGPQSCATGSLSLLTDINARWIFCNGYYYGRIRCKRLTRRALYTYREIIAIDFEKLLFFFFSLTLLCRALKTVSRRPRRECLSCD